MTSNNELNLQGSCMNSNNESSLKGSCMNSNELYQNQNSSSNNLSPEGKKVTPLFLRLYLFIAELGMSIEAKFLLSYLQGFSIQNKKIVVSDEHLASRFNRDERTIRRWLEELEKASLVNRIYSDNLKTGQRTRVRIDVLAAPPDKDSNYIVIPYSYLNNKSLSYRDITTIQFFKGLTNNGLEANTKDVTQLSGLLNLKGSRQTRNIISKLQPNYSFVKYNGNKKLSTDVIASDKKAVIGVQQSGNTCPAKRYSVSSKAVIRVHILYCYYTLIKFVIKKAGELEMNSDNSKSDILVEKIRTDFKKENTKEHVMTSQQFASRARAIDLTEITSDSKLPQKMKDEFNQQHIKSQLVMLSRTHYMSGRNKMPLALKDQSLIPALMINLQLINFKYDVIHGKITNPKSYVAYFCGTLQASGVFTDSDDYKAKRRRSDNEGSHQMWSDY